MCAARSSKVSGKTNPGKRHKATHQPSSSNYGESGNAGGFFSGLNFYILPTGIGSRRRTVFETQAVKYGGSVNKSVNKETTHVIVDETVTLGQVLSVLKWSSVPSGIKVVRSKWFSNCIKFNDCIDSKEHELKSPSVEDCYRNTEVRSDVKTTAAKEVNCKDEECIPNVAATDAHITEKQQAQWICSIPSNQNTQNFNKHITDKLEVLSTAYKNTNDHWRFLGYQKAIMALKQHPKVITSWEEAKSLRGVGERLADKIWEIVQSGHLRKIDEVCSGEKMKAISLFNKISGVGPSTAEMFVQQGLYTLEDLKASDLKLTKIQQIGLKYFDEFQERMPRSEAAEIISLVNDVVSSVDSRLQCIACGSYRRGRETCGDIDILITHPDGVSHHGVLPKIVSALHDANIMTDDMVSQEESGSHKKYMGVCKLPYGNNKHRRIDIIVVPCSEYACALMHFTGSAHFNRSIRLLASKKNMSLSEHSLRTGVVREGQKKVSEGCVLETPTEESIFKYLGLEYRVPEERDHFAIE